MWFVYWFLAWLCAWLTVLVTRLWHLAKRKNLVSLFLVRGIYSYIYSLILSCIKERKERPFMVRRWRVWEEEPPDSGVDYLLYPNPLKILRNPVVRLIKSPNKKEKCRGMIDDERRDDDEDLGRVEDLLLLPLSFHEINPKELNSGKKINPRVCVRVRVYTCECAGTGRTSRPTRTDAQWTPDILRESKRKPVHGNRWEKQKTSLWWPVIERKTTQKENFRRFKTR